MAIRLLATGDTTPLGLVRWETPSSQSQGNCFAATLGWGTLPRWGKRDAGEFGIPTGFHPSAQRCGFTATLGSASSNGANPNGVVFTIGCAANANATPLGLVRWGTPSSQSQGNGCAATLGCGRCPVGAREMTGSLESQRDSILQPRVAGCPLPWEHVRKQRPTPTGLCPWPEGRPMNTEPRSG